MHTLIGADFVLLGIGKSANSGRVSGPNWYGADSGYLSCRFFTTASRRLTIMRPWFLVEALDTAFRVIAQLVDFVCFRDHQRSPRSSSRIRCAEDPPKPLSTVYSLRFSFRTGCIAILGAGTIGMASAQTTANGPAGVLAKVTGAGSYGNGQVFVFLDQPISSCSTAARFDVAPTDPSVKYVLATAMLAIATSKSVYVHPSACTGSSVVWPADTGSYFYIVN
jgi:hypothetical protein